MDIAAFLSDPLLLVARNAAAIATARLDHWSGRLAGADVGSKDNPNDLVTVADGEIESLVLGYLTALRPQDTVIGEEHAEPRTLGTVPDSEKAAAALLTIPSCLSDGPVWSTPVEWHVDPIDGTVNFVRGIEHHCFSIGGKNPETGEWIVGLVASPALRSVWFARRGAGAWKTDRLPVPEGDGTVPTAAEAVPAGTFTRLTGAPANRRGTVAATGFGYARERRIEQFRRLETIMERFDDIRRCGSAAIDLCMAAEGKVDAYFERGLGIYDWAAGALIAEEAGVQVARAASGPEPTIAASDPELFTFLRAHA